MHGITDSVLKLAVVSRELLTSSGAVHVYKGCVRQPNAGTWDGEQGKTVVHNMMGKTTIFRRYPVVGTYA